MIAKKYRFHGRKALDFVYKKGRTNRGEYISVRLVDSRREDYRLAVVVSKKVSKSAVVRNRIRRRVYEIIRNYRLELGQPIQKDIVVNIFDDRAATISSQELSGTIVGLLKKARR